MGTTKRPINISNKEVRNTRQAAGLAGSKSPLFKRNHPLKFEETQDLATTFFHNFTANIPNIYNILIFSLISMTYTKLR